MENPKRARSWKRRLRPRVNLKNDVPVLYSTAAASRCRFDTLPLPVCFSNHVSASSSVGKKIQTHTTQTRKRKCRYIKL